MLIGAYRFDCQFSSPAILPAFKGSTLRGALGHSLKKIACALRRQQCADCLLTETCAYSFIFESHAYPHPPDQDNPRIAARPHPYILTPPLDSRREYDNGEPFDFTLTLFGRANDYLPHLVYAVEMAGKQGLGRNKGNGQGQFELTAISENGRKIYDGAQGVLEKNHPLEQLALPATPSVPVRELFVRLITPLRLKQQNHFQDRLPFHLLIRAALRRISSLEEAYGQGEPQLGYRGLVKRAEAVKIKKSDCKWIDLTRYSNRQKTAMQIGGLQGALVYEGDLTEFVPLLRYCETTHLGKQTAFGLGRIEVTTEGCGGQGAGGSNCEKQ